MYIINYIYKALLRNRYYKKILGNKYYKIFIFQYSKKIRPVLMRIPFHIRVILLTLVLSLIYLGGHVFNPEVAYFFQLYLGNHIFEPETAKFFEQYHGGEPFIYKMFSHIRFYDNQSAFQAREFSYVIDYIDAHFLLLSYRLGIVHFYSLFYYVAIFIISVLSYHIAITFYGQKNRQIALLVTLLYLTSSGPFFSGNYFRSSKILVSLFIVVIVYLILLIYRTSKRSFLLIIGLFISGVLMALSDMQGAYFLYAFIGITGLLTLSKLRLKTIFSFLFLLAGGLFYNYYRNDLGPWLVETIYGNRPVLGTVESMYDIYSDSKTITPLAIKYLLVQTSFLLGNTTTIISTIILTALFLILLISSILRVIANKKKLLKNIRIIMTNFIPFFLLVGSIPMLVITLSYSRSFIEWPDLVRYYYNLPIATIILLFLQLMLSKFTRLSNKQLSILQKGLILMLILNIISIPFHYKNISNGQYIKPYFETNKTLRECIGHKYPPAKYYLGVIPQHSQIACEVIRLKTNKGEEPKPIKEVRIPRDKITLPNFSFPTCLSSNYANNLYNIKLSAFLSDSYEYYIHRIRDKITFRYACSGKDRIKIYRLAADEGFDMAKRFGINNSNELSVKAASLSGNHMQRAIEEYIKIDVRELNFDLTIPQDIREDLEREKEIINQLKEILPQEMKDSYDDVMYFIDGNLSMLDNYEKEKSKNQ